MHGRKFQEAEPLLRGALKEGCRLEGLEEPFTLLVMHELADCLAGLDTKGAASEAKEVYRRCMRLRTKLLGSTSEATLLTMSNLAQLHLRTAEYGEAEPLLRRVYKAKRDSLGADHRDSDASLLALGDCLMEQVVRSWTSGNGCLGYFHAGEHS